MSVPVLFAVNVMLSGCPDPSIVGYDSEKLTRVMIVIGGPVGGGVGGGAVTGGATVVVVVGTVDWSSSMTGSVVDDEESDRSRPVAGVQEGRR